MQKINTSLLKAMPAPVYVRFLNVLKRQTSKLNYINKHRNMQLLYDVTCCNKTILLYTAGIPGIVYIFPRGFKPQSFYGMDCDIYVYILTYYTNACNRDKRHRTKLKSNNNVVSTAMYRYVYVKDVKGRVKISFI